MLYRRLIIFPDYLNYNTSPLKEFPDYLNSNSTLLKEFPN